MTQQMKRRLSRNGFGALVILCSGAFSAPFLAIAAFYLA